MRFSFILISFYLVFSSHNLSAGELKISRDGYLHNEGTSSIYNITIKLVNPWNQSVIFTNKFKRNTEELITNLDNGKYNLVIEFRSKVKGNVKNEYQVQINEDQLHVVIGKNNRNISHPKLTMVKQKYGYGLNEIKVSKTQVVRKSDNQNKKVVTNAPKSLSKPKQENPSKNRADEQVSNLLDELRQGRISYSDVVQALEDLLKQKVISEEDFRKYKSEALRILLSS